MTALAASTKRGRPQGETNSCKLVTKELSLEVHRHGQSIASWPLRLWNPCGVRDRKPVWASEERSKEDLRNLRSWLRQAMRGPPEELEQRLAACAETPRDDSKIKNFTRDFRAYTESEGKKNHEPPPVLSENSTTYDAGLAQLEHGEVSRYGWRIIAADTARMFDIASAARQLKITRPLLCELVDEFHNPQRRRIPLVPRHGLTQPESGLAWRTYRPYPVPSTRLLLSERIKILWERGCRSSRAIASRLLANPAAVKDRFFPRSCIGGPCLKCESHYRHQRIRLDMAFCPHNSVAFALHGEKVRVQGLSQPEFLAEMRRIEPKTTKPALPAWPGSSSGFRYRYYELSGQGPRTIHDDFAGIMNQFGKRQHLNNPTLQLEKHFPKGDELWTPG